MNVGWLLNFNLTCLGDNVQEWLMAINHEVLENTVFRLSEVPDYATANDLTAGLEKLEIICKAVLSRKDVKSEDRKFKKERLEWIKRQKEADRRYSGLETNEDSL